MNPTSTYQGIFPPMITPLNSDFSLDVAHTEKIIEHLIDGGVHGIFILGTTGESASVSPDVKSDLIRLTCKKVNGIKIESRFLRPFQKKLPRNLIAGYPIL